MTNALLEKLLKACNKSSALVERQKFNITQKRYDFYHLLTISERLKCHEQLEIIGRQTGALRVNYAAKAFGEEDLIESIVLSDVRQLCNLLNIPVHSENNALAIAAVETIKDSCPPWLSEILAEIQEGWRQGKKPYHFSTADHHKIKDICTFVAWAESVNDSQLVALDIRTVSVQLFNDSKRLEKLASKVKLLMKNQLPKEVQELDSVEVLAYLGVSRFPPLFRFKGVVSIQFRTGEMATTHCWPNIGISPDGIVNVAISKPPNYVLFIENQTTFERYCREVNDSGLIFYTNGFPSRTWQSLYTKIEGLLSPNTPLFVSVNITTRMPA